MYDTIKASLECPYCGTHVSAAEVEIQTRAFANPSLRVFVVGDKVTLAPDLEAAGYLRIGHSGTGIAVLETWSCPRCGAWRWARIEVVDGRLAAVEAAPLTESGAAHSDYIGDDFWPFLTDAERGQIANAHDRERLRKAFVRIQNDIEAHRDDPVSPASPTGFDQEA